MFLQLLPTLLRAEKRGAAVAFLDFIKAYDTVDRSFLLAAMECMGVGAGFMRWVRTLLSHTPFVALINGFCSHEAHTRAGVRQGCPLSPLLYLFVAQALQCWLLASDVGIMVAGARRAATQFADDTQALLASLDASDVERFLAIMRVFGCASGQHLNLSKCELLPVGTSSPDSPAPGTYVAGIKVVAAATSLGIQYLNAGDSTAAGTEVDWPARLSTVKACYSKISLLHLSTFGRAFAASTYGVMHLLYHAEFGGIPADTARDLATITTKLVDRGSGPGDPKRKLPGIPSALLPGHPSVGGFGAMPWERHISSRHATWGARLMRALAAGVTARSPLWHCVAHALLTYYAGGDTEVLPVVPPALALVAASAAAPGWFSIAGGRMVPRGPLHRMMAGLRALHPTGGRPIDVAAAELPPVGPWCVAMPLWGNPLLPVSCAC